MDDFFCALFLENPFLLAFLLLSQAFFNWFCFSGDNGDGEGEGGGDDGGCRQSWSKLRLSRGEIDAFSKSKVMSSSRGQFTNAEEKENDEVDTPPAETPSSSGLPKLLDCGLGLLSVKVVIIGFILVGVTVYVIIT